MNRSAEVASVPSNLMRHLNPLSACGSSLLLSMSNGPSILLAIFWEAR